MAEQDNSSPLTATQFTPLEKHPQKRRNRPSAALLFTAGFTLVAVVILVFLFAARAIILRLTPQMQWWISVA